MAASARIIRHVKGKYTIYNKLCNTYLLFVRKKIYRELGEVRTNRTKVKNTCEKKCSSEIRPKREFMLTMQSSQRWWHICCVMSKISIFISFLFIWFAKHNFTNLVFIYWTHYFVSVRTCYESHMSLIECVCVTGLFLHIANLVRIWHSPICSKILSDFDRHWTYFELIAWLKIRSAM